MNSDALQEKEERFIVLLEDKIFDKPRLLPPYYMFALSDLITLMIEGDHGK